jgi:periplasmic protein TonB
MGAFLKWIQTSRTAGAAEGGAGGGSGLDQEQRRRLQLALAVLVVALIVVVVRDIGELRPPAPVNTESAAVEPSTPPAPPPAIPETASVPAPSEPAKPQSVKPARTAKTKQPPVKRPVRPAEESISAGGPPGAPTIVATDRAVLPPLQVQVVAGNQAHPVAPASNSVNVDMQGGVPADVGQASAAPAATNPTAAAAQVTLSPDVAQHVAHSVAPNYPLLAKQMKVQGAVVLQALIDKGGKIQNLRVLSGPTILAAAAEEAVKQWRFKPYYQGGQPVETEARVSVNFTISTF